jgi:predicted CXXCH cytochrome family protein
LESSNLLARLVQVLLVIVSAGWILHPADSAHGAPPVFDKPGYVYHPDVKKCSGCHPQEGKGYRVTRPVDAMCYRCHGRKDTKKYLHGPLGSGDCISCHDPHGSPNRFLTVAGPQVLCRMCHDQKSSEKHILRAKGKGCVTCHDPHSSNKTFLLK